MLRFKQLYKDGCSWQNLEFLRATRSHPSVVKNLFHSKQITRVEQEYWYENEYCKDDNHKIWMAYDDKLECQIGYVQYHIESLVHRRCSVNYVVAPQFQAYKYDKKLIRWTVSNIMNFEIDFNRIHTFVFPEDDIRVMNYTSCGFEIDGVLRKYVFKDGVYRDVWVLSNIMQS
jgi:RimJ/RimL family protein N-acetyltransferase